MNCVQFDASIQSPQMKRKLKGTKITRMEWVSRGSQSNWQQVQTETGRDNRDFLDTWEKKGLRKNKPYKTTDKGRVNFWQNRTRCFAKGENC